MRKVRIIAIPPGEAPQEVREAWVGLVLPIHRGLFGYKRSWRSFGVLSAPKGELARLWAALTGKAEQRTGYAVNVTAAIRILEVHNWQAANWWKQNTPYLVRPGKFFLFPHEVCLELF
jgi:hypothetical protein